ncbi:MAG: hypothetical protein KAR25_08810 [Methanosarcinales archaeon]|nr:hypothetical protein [Methanosarcinales archaeon]
MGTPIQDAVALRVAATVGAWTCGYEMQTVVDGCPAQLAGLARALACEGNGHEAWRWLCIAIIEKNIPVLWK